MNDIELMDFDEATQVVMELGEEYGYTDFKTFATTYGNSLDKITKISRDIKGWDCDYLIALLSLGPHYGLKEKADLRADGTGRQSAWYTIANAIRKELDYQSTTVGKKDMLRKLAPVEVRGTDEDALEKKRNARVKTDTMTGKIGKSKKQARINEERLQHIYALEETLNEGGSLRTLCNELLEEHNKNIDNLPTNEEAAVKVMKERRKNRVKSLILSWFIMPLYVLIRAIDILCDSVIVAKVKDDEIESRFSPNAPLLGRLTIPFLLSGFVAFTEIIGVINGSEEAMNGDVSFHFIMIFLGALLVITIVKSLIGFPVAYAADYYGRIVEWASDRFDSLDEYIYQFGEVEYSAANYEYYKEVFNERQNVICDLRDAIANNEPRCELDDLRKRGAFSLTTLQKEKEAFLNTQRKGK